MADKKFLNHLDDVHLATHTKYLDITHGSDSNNGSYYFPYQDLDYALGNLQSGQHLKLKPGTYPDSVGMSLKSNVVIEGMGEVVITSLISMSQCENITFRNITFLDFNPGQNTMFQPKNIIFDKCNFSSNDILFDIADLAGNVKFIDCSISGTLRVTSKGVDSATSSLQIIRNDSRDCAVVGIDTDSIIHVKDSIIKFIGNQSSTEEILHVELDRLSHDGNLHDIPLTGKSNNIQIIDQTSDRIKQLSHVGMVKDSDFTIDTKYMHQTIYLDASNGIFNVTLPNTGQIGAEINLEDLHSNTWSTTNFVRVFVEGSSNSYELNVPGGLISFYYDGTSWKGVTY